MGVGRDTEAGKQSCARAPGGRTNRRKPTAALQLLKASGRQARALFPNRAQILITPES